MNYKLHKIYPGSPDLGYISKPKGQTAGGGFDHYWSGTWFDPGNYPEFWERVVEKNYEILSFIHDGSHGVPLGYIINMKDGMLDSANQKLPESHYLDSQCWKINSVKRLSDGEIFTVGDRVNNSTFGGDGTIERIRTILYYDLLSILVRFDKLDEDSDDSECFLNCLSKLKVPTLITEDGDSIFYVDMNIFQDNASDYIWKITKLCIQNKKYIPIGLCKFFSTQKLAEEYIEENKPQYSKKDLLYFVHESRHYHTTIPSSTVLSELIELRKIK